MNASEKRELGTGDYTNSKYTIFRKVTKLNDKPAAFIEIFTDPDYQGNGYIAVASTEKARGKGLVKELIDDGIKYSRNNPDINNLIWECAKTNEASKGLANKFGFEKSSELEEDIEYTLNIKTLNHSSKGGDMSIYRESSYLAHHGVKGQKWYQRRYQNKDGTLTPLGRARLLKKARKYESKAASSVAENYIAKSRKARLQQKAKDARSEVKRSDMLSRKNKKETAERDKNAKSEALAAKKEEILKSRSAAELYKNANLFTDQELKTAYNRLSLENDIKRLDASTVNKGKSTVQKIADVTQTVNNLSTSSLGIYNNVAKVRNAVSDGDPWPVFDGKKKEKK